MQLLTQDIIIRNKTTWLSHAMLLRTCNGLTDNYLASVRSLYKATVAPSFHDREILPDTGKSWRWATINNTFYYAYNNIPDKNPAKYRSHLPTLQELTTAATDVMVSLSNHDFEAYLKQYLYSHYTSYLHCYNECSPTQQTNLARAAALLEGSIQYIRDNNINIKKYAFFGQLAAFINKYEVKYFPENPRVIKRKIEPIINNTSLGEGRGEVAITDIIRLPRASNANAAKGFNDEEIRSWVFQLRDMGQNFTNAFIIRKIKDMCTLTSKPCPADRWIGGIMEEHNTKFLTAGQRYGSRGRLAAIYRGYQPFQNALFAGDCWQIDGSRVNITSHSATETYIDKNGIEKQRKIQQFLYIVSVRDVHSGEILGRHYDITEDRWAVFNAIKMAVKNAGYLPYEMVFDKFPGHNTPEMIHFLADLQRWGTKVTLSSDPNVKPGLERWFGTLQTVFMQESAFYYGQGIKSRRNYAHRSEDHIKRMRREANKIGFSWDDACSEADTILDAYSNTPYCKWSRKHHTVQQSPAELHEISSKPHIVKLEEQDYYFLFGLKVALPHNLGLIKKVVQGIDFYYRVTDYNTISTHGKVCVCYDMDDLSQVMLYSLTQEEITAGKLLPAPAIRQYLGRAQEEVPAQRYGPNAEWGVIEKRKALIKELRGYSEQEVEYRKAVGDGVDITQLIAPMSTSKHEAELNETKYLNTSNDVMVSLSNHDEEDNDFNVRNAY